MSRRRRERLGRWRADVLGGCGDMRHGVVVVVVVIIRECLGLQMPVVVVVRRKLGFNLDFFSTLANFHEWLRFLDDGIELIVRKR